MPKVLHEVCGRPMLAYVLDACRQAGVKRLYVVVGYGSELVKKRFSDSNDIVWVHQNEQKGTAHAVSCCREHLEGFDGQTLVLCGDGPLIRAETLKMLIEKHQTEKAALTLATTLLDDPTGYGRVIRHKTGNVTGIVEHNDCTAEQLAVKEVNPSYYMFDNRMLFEALKLVKNDNAKKEYYLTDTLSIMLKAGQTVTAAVMLQPEEAVSVNTRQQLEQIEKIMGQRMFQAEKGNEKQECLHGKAKQNVSK